MQEKLDAYVVVIQVQPLSHTLSSHILRTDSLLQQCHTVPADHRWQCVCELLTL